jgi:hypothetical protein
MTEAECQERLYGGPREIKVIRPEPSPVATLPKIRRLFGLRERKAA